MNRIIRKTYSILTLFAVLLIPLSTVPVLASEPAPAVYIPETLILVDQANGQFSFTIQVDSQESYAGAEFGIICSQGVDITAVESTGGSVTGPQKANGLVWFGFFSGQDSFRGVTTVTVSGTCPIGFDCAVVIQDVSLYTVGQEEYSSTALECGTIVNLRCRLEESAEPTEIPTEMSPNTGIDAPLLIICLSVIAAGLAGTLIYKLKKNQPKKTRKEKENASEETEV